MSFASVAECVAALDAQKYLIDQDAAVTAYLAVRMEKPVLVEGPAGVGKTELALALAGALGRELIRLQCYEGLDEAKALYEWEYAKQLLYTQLLRDKLAETVGDAATLNEALERIYAQDDVFFSDRFLLERPLLRAIRSEQPCVLLIDEVDKSDAEFEAFLLEMLGDFQVTVPELGTLRARSRPVVVLTSNATREMSDALRRRCLHLHLDFPGAEREQAIIRRRVPEASEQLASQVTVPELGTLRARSRPVVVLTSNATREMSDALRRRCLHLHLDFPNAEREQAIIRRRVPEASEQLASQVARAMARMRTLGLRKKPSISESIDWARALVILNADTLGEQVVSETLSLVLKYEGDMRTGRENLRSILDASAN